jgi:Na+-driven multidrug efflux pump
LRQNLACFLISTTKWKMSIDLKTKDAMTTTGQHQDVRPGTMNALVVAATFCLVTHIGLSLLFDNETIQYFSETVQWWLLAIISTCVAFLILSCSGMFRQTKKRSRYLFITVISGLVFGGMLIFLTCLSVFMGLMFMISTKSSQDYPW